VKKVRFKDAHYIIFSKNRPMQLDLLVRSLQSKIGPDRITVLISTTPKYKEGYLKFEQSNKNIEVIMENNFMKQVIEIVKSSDKDFISFLVDDIIFYKKPDRPYFNYSDSIVCFSPRIGLDHNYCHPAKSRYTPLRELGSCKTEDKIQYNWKWMGMPFDIGYPFSLDGNIFESSIIKRSVLSCRPFSNPNTLEDSLVYFNPVIGQLKNKEMSCFEKSFLVNVPANRVNSTHPNLAGTEISYNEEDLQDLYLSGFIIDENKMDFSQINQSHQEMEFVFVQM